MPSIRGIDLTLLRLEFVVALQRAFDPLMLLNKVNINSALLQNTIIIIMPNQSNCEMSIKYMY